MTYDGVYELARKIKQSHEYLKYEKAKEAALSDDTNAALLKQYQKLSFEAQAYATTKKEVPEDLKQQLQSLYSVIQLNQECMDYLASEYTFHAAMSDVFRILTQEVGIDFQFLSE